MKKMRTPTSTRATRVASTPIWVAIQGIAKAIPIKRGEKI
jgi:hypothetical protein